MYLYVYLFNLFYKNGIIIFFIYYVYLFISEIIIILRTLWKLLNFYLASSLLLDIIFSFFEIMNSSFSIFAHKSNTCLICIIRINS